MRYENEVAEEFSELIKDISSQVQGVLQIKRNKCKKYTKIHY